MEIVKLISMQKQVSDVVKVDDLYKNYNDSELSIAYFEFRVQFHLVLLCSMLGCKCKFYEFFYITLPF